jgi:hypothetical protein
MPTDAEAPRWLVVVRADRPELFARLQLSFEGNTQVEVLLDRRRADRRRVEAPVTADRRRRPRRRGLTAHTRAIWEDAGFRLAPAAPVRLRGGPADPAASADTAASGLRAERIEDAGKASADVGMEATTPHERFVAPESWRLCLLKAWLDVCLDALRSERLDICRSYLALGIGMLGDGNWERRDREVARHGEGDSMRGADPGLSGR